MVLLHTQYLQHLKQKATWPQYPALGNQLKEVYWQGSINYNHKERMYREQNSEDSRTSAIFTPNVLGVLLNSNDPTLIGVKEQMLVSHSTYESSPLPQYCPLLHLLKSSLLI